MSKRFVAYGKLYRAGKELYPDGPHIALDKLGYVLMASPERVPVMCDYLGRGTIGPDKVIGRAEFSVDGEYITTKIVFNERWRKAYESLLQCPKCRSKHRLGFVIRNCVSDKYTGEVATGIITYVTIKPGNLGDEIERFGWEEDNNE